MCRVKKKNNNFRQREHWGTGDSNAFIHPLFLSLKSCTTQASTVASQKVFFLEMQQERQVWRHHL